MSIKTVFYLTDCSVDSARSLRKWLADNPEEAIHLTVVFPYDIEIGLSLDKETYRFAKQQANARLTNWLDVLSPAWSGELKSETLLAKPELAIHMHLLFRSYDYFVIDDQAISETILRQTKAKLHRLSEYTFSSQTV